MSFLAECGTFLRESRRHFHDTGSVMPSSRFLGRALASELRKPHEPARILEAGPGTGSVTRQILSALAPGDQLDLVEINPEFVATLKRRFETEPDFVPFRERMRIIRAPLEAIEGENVYPFIVSGLPLNNFSHGLIRTIFRAFDRLVKPGGNLSYFEYAWVRQLKTPFCGREEKRRLFRVGHVVDKYLRTHEVKRQQILRNVPPALVHHLRLKS